MNKPPGPDTDTGSIEPPVRGLTPAALRRRWHRLTGFMSDGVPPNNSLFGEILDWLWVPMMVLMPVSILFTFAAAKALSHAPFDRALADNAAVLAEQVKLRGGRVVADLPLAARDLLRADDTDSVYFQVTGQRGEFVSGDRDLPLPPEDEVPVPGEVRFRNDEMRGSEVRIAYTWVELPRVAGSGPQRKPATGKPGAADDAPRQTPSPRAEAAPRLPLVQVAETLEKRALLADEIVKGVILPQFVILPFAAVLIWFGLARGLHPLSTLVDRIHRRRPGDLSPIPHGAVPVEVEPLIDSINDLMRQLDSSLQGQQRFIANAAHQLRTPLAGIQMQTELARRQLAAGGEGVELERSLAQMALATRRLVRMVNQLLALTRVEKGAAAGSAPRLTRLDLAALARERVQHWVPVARDKAIDLGFDAADGMPGGEALWIAGNAALLAELLNNLMENAIHYTPEGGAITLRLRSVVMTIRLEVEDSGVGIAPEERALVFERFYRVLGAAGGASAEGSGLGLAIVREIASGHRAEVRIADAPGGRGTVFIVEFPQAEAAAQAAISKPASHAHAVGAGRASASIAAPTAKAAAPDTVN